jgi:hypothetical protein
VHRIHSGPLDLTLALRYQYDSGIVFISTLHSHCPPVLTGILNLIQVSSSWPFTLFPSTSSLLLPLIPPDWRSQCALLPRRSSRETLQPPVLYSTPSSPSFPLCPTCLPPLHIPPSLKFPSSTSGPFPFHKPCYPPPRFHLLLSSHCPLPFLFFSLPSFHPSPQFPPSPLSLLSISPLPLDRRTGITGGIRHTLTLSTLSFSPL